MKLDKSAPRYQAGRMKLPEGAGEITTMFSGCGFLEIFTETASYNIQSPESIDPQETNPNAPWVTYKSSDFGSSNKIVARVLLQSEEILKSALLKNNPVDKSEVIQLIYDCKEALLICDKVSDKIRSAYDEIAKKITGDGINVEGGGRYINSFPQITNLDENVTSYLINIKRAIGKICFLAEKFLPMSKQDNNLEHLIKNIKKLDNKDFDKLLEFLEHYKEGAKHLIELRNYQEHPGEKTTHIDNFKVMPNGQISNPLWYVTGKEPSALVDEMESAIDFVITLCEMMLIHLVFICLESNIPYYLEETPNDKINKKIPIKYKLSIDISKLEFAK